MSYSALQSEMVVRAHIQEEQDLDSLPWQHMGSPVQPSISLGCVTLLSKYRINWKISLLIFHCCYYPKITQNKLQTTVREKNKRECDHSCRKGTLQKEKVLGSPSTSSECCILLKGFTAQKASNSGRFNWWHFQRDLNLLRRTVQV